MKKALNQCCRLALVVDILYSHGVISDAIYADLLEKIADAIIDESYVKGEKDMKNNIKRISMLVENDRIQKTIADLNRRMKEMNMYWNIKVVPVDEEVSRVYIG